MSAETIALLLPPDNGVQVERFSDDANGAVKLSAHSAHAHRGGLRVPEPNESKVGEALRDYLAGETVFGAVDIVLTRDEARQLAERILEELTEPPSTWRELFPEGLFIFYEGDDPEGFAAGIRGEFGFDPSEHDGWDSGYGFFCPPEHLDAIYGSDRWELGS